MTSGTLSRHTGIFITCSLKIPNISAQLWGLGSPTPSSILSVLWLWRLVILTSESQLPLTGSGLACPSISPRQLFKSSQGKSNSGPCCAPLSRGSPPRQFSNHLSVQFNHSVGSSSLWPHGLQHARPPCPSPTLGAYSNSAPSSRWCHPTTSSSVVLFSHLQSFPASGSFPMSQFFASGGQSIGVSASASVLPVNIQDWFPLGWTGWIFLQSKGLSRVFSNTTVQTHQFFGAQLSLWSNSHIHTWLLEKP